MEITEVKVFPVREEKLKAFASVVFSECFMVNDIKVIKGRDGFFISMPSRKKKNGKFKDVAHPLNNETRQKIERRILDEYERIVGEAAEAPLRRPAAKREPSAPPQPAPVEQKPHEEIAPAVVSGDQVPPDSRLPDDQSLEEVAEHHLRDSFWST